MEYRHYELGRELAATGMSVVVISGSHSHLFAAQPRVTGGYAFERIDGLIYCWVRTPAYTRSMSIGRVFNMVVFMLRLYRLPTGRLPRPDAIIVSSPSPFPILPAKRWARRWGARLVFEVRDLWPLTLQELGGLSDRHPLVMVMDWFERRAYRDADVVVSLLPAAATHFESRGLPSGRLSVIPNGVSESALVDPTTEAPDTVRAAVDGASFVVGFVGTLGMANALETLIEAARLLEGEGIRLVIVGRGPDEDRLRAKAAGLSHVVFAGPVPKADVPATLRRFDVCYVGFHKSPLYRFGIAPNKVYDYMAAGRPIILAAEAANDVVREAECGVSVPPEDPAALAEAIRSLRAMSPEDLARLGANGRDYVRREHGYRGLAMRYRALLDRSGT
jgi:glycosyltransferase involved in cell wall biosynthesis